MAEKIIRRKLGRERKYDSLVGVVKYDDPPRHDWEAANEEALLESLAHHEQAARDTLKAAGLPTAYPGAYKRDDGTVCTLDGLVDGRENEPEWWAARILQAAHMVRRYIEKQQPAQAAHWGMLLQRTVDGVFVRSIEYDALHGRKRRPVKHDDDAKRHWAKIADDLRKENAGISYRAIAREIRDRTGASENTIYEHIRTHLNAKTGR